MASSIKIKNIAYVVVLNMMFLVTCNHFLILSYFASSRVLGTGSQKESTRTAGTFTNFMSPTNGDGMNATLSESLGKNVVDARVTLWNTDVRRKHRLILHVGPPKTATTSLQFDLTRLQPELASNAYVYAGRYYFREWVPKQNKTMLRRTDSKLLTTLRSLFRGKTCSRTAKLDVLYSCVSPFERALVNYKNSSVIISDEGLSRLIGHRAFFQALRDVLSSNWDITVVLGYRRFFQWLPSDMFQRYRMDKTKGLTNWKNYWPGEKYGEEVTLLFPWYYKHWSEMGHQFSDSLVENLSGLLSYRIIDLHDEKRSPLVQLLCDILSDAPISCAEATRMTQCGDVSVANEAKEVLHVNYDMLATGAAALGRIDKDHYRRSRIRTMIRDFTERRLNKTAWDFEMECPARSQLKEFLEMSLDLEAKTWGKDMSLARKTETQTAFWRDVEDKKFCVVDATKTLQREPWKRFFEAFSPDRKS